MSAVLSALGTFVGYFRAVILGAVFAYLLSPLAIFFSTKVFRGKVFDKTRWALSVILAVAVMLLAMTLLIGTLLPQLIDSIVLFSANIDGYATSLMYLIENSSLYNLIDQESFMTFSQNSLTSVTNFIKENAGNIVGFAASSGKNIASTVIAMILAIYLLMDSKRVVNGVKQLFSLVLPETGYKLFRDFVVRCDNILINYIVSRGDESGPEFRADCRRRDRCFYPHPDKAYERSWVRDFLSAAADGGWLYSETETVLRFARRLGSSDSVLDDRAREHVQRPWHSPVDPDSSSAELSLS